jgi:transcriptional regulator with XRE-family HTH domain
MVIGEKLKVLREQKNMSQGDIEKRTGLLRCYTSRVENGHTVPSIDTLEKMARALGVPTYRLFTDEAHVKKPVCRQNPFGVGWSTQNKSASIVLSPNYFRVWIIRAAGF